MPNCLPEKLCQLALLPRCSSLTLLSQEPPFSRLTWAFSPQVRKDFQVIVEDRNDNAPVFQNTSFSTDISEVTSVLMVCVLGGGGWGTGILEALLRVGRTRDSQQGSGLGRAPAGRGGCRNEIQGMQPHEQWVQQHLAVNQTGLELLQL